MVSVVARPAQASHANLGPLSPNASHQRDKRSKRSEIAEFEELYFQPPLAKSEAGFKQQLKAIHYALSTDAKNQSDSVRHLVMAGTASKWLSTLGKQWAPDYHWRIVHAILPSVIDPWNIRLTERELSVGGISVMDCYYRDLGELAGLAPTSIRSTLSLWVTNGLTTGRNSHWE